MSSASRYAGFVAFVLSYTSTGAAAPPTIADFAADADFRFPALSPDGNKVAFVTRVQDQRLLVMLDLVQRKRIGLMPATTESFELEGVRWAFEDLAARRPELSLQTPT